jgi:biopolymer transport protein ExbD
VSALLKALVAIAGLAALTPAYSASRSLPITLQIRDAAICYVSVDDSEFRLPDDAKLFAQRLKQLRKRWRAASIVGDTNVPYRCVGHVIYIAQSAGFKKVGFAALPSQ